MIVEVAVIAFIGCTAVVCGSGRIFGGGGGGARGSNPPASPISMHIPLSLPPFLGRKNKEEGGSEEEEEEKRDEPLLHV